jgi:integrase
VRRARQRESRGNARRNLDAWVDGHLPIGMRARAKACWFRGWRQQLALLLEAFGRRREDGGVASFETHRSRSDVLYLAFGQLREVLGCKLQDVRVFRTRHLRKLLAHWTAQGIEASTINLRLSVLRGFARWIGKAGVVPGTKDLGSIGFGREVAARVTYATSDKSWDGVFDKERVFREVEVADRRYGLIFRVQDAFGLRRLEAIRFRPHEDDRGDHLAILAGTKGGRPRQVPVATAEQRALVEECKAAVEQGDSLSGKEVALKVARRRYKHLAEKLGITRAALGVTGHGLRHGYLHRRYREELGIEVPVRGAGVGRRTGRQAREAKRRMAEEMGHSRSSVLAAYSGTVRRPPGE